LCINRLTKPVAVDRLTHAHARGGAGVTRTRGGRGPWGDRPPARIVLVHAQFLVFPWDYSSYPMDRLGDEPPPTISGISGGLL